MGHVRKKEEKTNKQSTKYSFKINNSVCVCVCVCEITK